MTQNMEFVHAQDVIRANPEVTSLGVTRVLASAAGSPGEERPYQTGDEVLVEQGVAEWVVAPVHTPAAGRRLDTDAEREPVPQAGVEAYPPAEPTTGVRRSQARAEGTVPAQADQGVAEQLAKARVQAAQQVVAGSDAQTQAQLGTRGARSGPVSSASELPADQPPPADEAAAKGSKSK